MGITCRPTGKMQSMIRKTENEAAKAKAERIAKKGEKKSKKK